MSAQLSFDIYHQTIKRTDSFKPVARSNNYLRAHFIFTQDWGNDEKIALFYGTGKARSPYSQILDENNECDVPWEAICEPGTMYVSVYSGDLITASLAPVQIHDTGYTRYKTTTSEASKDAFAEALKKIDKIIDEDTSERISSLDDTKLAVDAVIEAVGNPVYVSDVSEHSDFGITETGWYIFSRINAKKGTTVPADITVEGAAGYIANEGDDHIDVAVRFDVAAVSQLVVINWGDSTDNIVFKATDLAIRNLDYRVTFYVYDIDEFANWEYTPATDATIAADKYYYKKVNGKYVLVEDPAVTAVPAYYTLDGTTYTKTTDETFEDGKTYYTKDVWYVYEESHPLTTDTVFLEGKKYFILVNDIYELADVTPGDPVTPDTYYEWIYGYSVTKDTTFVEGQEYLKYNFVNDSFIPDHTVEYGTSIPTDSYSVANVTVGTQIPTYYVHSKVTFSGMTRNITYRCNTPIDCPVVFDLPEIEDETHGCWFEIRFQHTGSFSSTLVVPEGVKVATEHTQAETKGMNMVDLHYTSVGGVKLWRFMNTHSSIPA